MNMTSATADVETLRQLAGTRGASRTTDVERSMIRKFAHSIGTTNPLYFDDEYAASTRFKGMIAPPTFVCALKSPWPELPVSMPFTTHLHTDDRIRSFKVIKPGDIITSICELAGAFEKSGRSGPMLFIVRRFEMIDQDGAVVATIDTTNVQF
jgi:acyl dehydratase